MVSIMAAMKTHLLGGLTPNRFLRHYWQKKPLLVRAAVPGFTGLIAKPALHSRFKSNCIARTPLK